MGVYIKGMDKVSDCMYCLFYSHGYCNAKHSRCNSEFGIDADCPLVEVKTPHGRLIDADKLDAYKLPNEKQDFKTWHKHSAEYKHAVPVFNSALGMVKNHAPTVIEAEGE